MRVNVVRNPALWLPVALAVLTLAGVALLRQDAVVHLSERDRSAYDDVNPWRWTFDALSATCGTGLLLFDLREEYTPLGRGVLATLGLAGAVLYLLAARQMLERLWPGSGLPRGRTILLSFLAVQALAIPVAAVALRLCAAPQPLADTAAGTISAFASLGWVPSPPGDAGLRVYAAVAFVSALGWPGWLAWRGRSGRGALLIGATSYIGFLAACALLIAALEVPRGGAQHRARADQVDTRFAARAGRAAVQVAAAAGAGLPTEQIADRGVSEGTKLIVAAVVLVGGLGGSPGGGVKWFVLLWGLAAVVGTRKSCASAERTRRGVLAGTLSAGLLFAWTGIIALGLLLIEAQVGSRFQSPPTLADALLDAASAVGGAGLTSGLVPTLTAPTLSSGIRLSVDLYQYGLGWLLLAMFVGRLLPIWALARAAAVRPREDAGGWPPVP